MADQDKLFPWPLRPLARLLLWLAVAALAVAFWFVLAAGILR
ncbi:hypothetical protein [Nonomuraea sediminis]|nr:hypothetical protein [Nonomuraea sediminis]